MLYGLGWIGMGNGSVGLDGTELLVWIAGCLWASVSVIESNGYLVSHETFIFIMRKGVSGESSTDLDAANPTSTPCKHPPIYGFK